MSDYIKTKDVRTLGQKIREYILYKPIYLNYKWSEFKRSFKWHVKCYLVFWRLPTILEHTIDGLYASQSLSKSMKERLQELKEKNNISEEDERDWEEVMEDELLAMPGGPDYDERPVVLQNAIEGLENNKFKSKYFGDWGIDV